MRYREIDDVHLWSLSLYLYPDYGYWLTRMGR